MTGKLDWWWPFNGQVTNGSSKTVWGYDWSTDEFMEIRPGEESSNLRDVDDVPVGDRWYKIGPWDFDVGPDGSPDDGFDLAPDVDLEQIQTWPTRHPKEDWQHGLCE